MQRSTKKHHHFVLIHGICHGAWCWYKLVSLLKLAGHGVTALDLGACGVNPSKFEEVVSMADYVNPLMKFMASLKGEEKVVLVGHSYGGLCISLAMENFPNKVSVGVFVSAYLPHFTQPPSALILEFFKRSSAESIMDCQLTFHEEEGYQNLPKSVGLGSDYTDKMYQHCELEEIELAKMLLRPGNLFIKDMAKESLLTKEGYGSIKTVYVICESDPILDEDLQRYMIQNGDPEEVKSITGAGHMVMLSKPKLLFEYLQDIAERYDQ